MKIDIRTNTVRAHSSDQNAHYDRLIGLAATIALAGFILSGPVGFAIVMFTKPQPAWISAEVFAAHYYWIQDVPFYFGFLLVAGMLMLMAGHYLNYQWGNARVRFHLLLSLAWTIIFAALICFNYISQTTFVHNLALHYRPEFDPMISTFSMSNPLSLCWANEMWGYFFLGIATAMLSEYYKERHSLLRWLLILNLIMSTFSAIAIVIDVNWMMSIGGLICYFVWNVLMILITVLIKFDSKKQTNPAL